MTAKGPRGILSQFLSIGQAHWQSSQMTKELPSYDELPTFNDFKGCAWDVWGPDDQLGTVNLLDEAMVQRAAQEEIKSGKSVSLNWPLNFPEKPVFGRRAPEIKMKAFGLKSDGPKMVRDDEIHINTQSGTQWDGLRHMGILEHGVFYNNTLAESMPTGVIPIPDPRHIDPALMRLGIQSWAEHGICGRGVLLDLVEYHTKGGNRSLPYDPWSPHGITVDDLEACAKAEGVTFRQGDILILRVGFIQKYNGAQQEERDELAENPPAFGVGSGRLSGVMPYSPTEIPPASFCAGIEQTEDMKRFLWNNHFAAIASDQPALERWPPIKGAVHLHQTLLGMWGMPIGEFFDLEKLSKTCSETGRYTFFFSSWPLNIIGGCASPPNAAAFF